MQIRGKVRVRTPAELRNNLAKGPREVATNVQWLPWKSQKITIVTAPDLPQLPPEQPTEDTGIINRYCASQDWLIFWREWTTREFENSVWRSSFFWSGWHASEKWGTFKNSGIHTLLLFGYASDHLSANRYWNAPTCFNLSRIPSVHRLFLLRLRPPLSSP